MAKNANKMNGLDHKFCIAPMMDWTESLGGSMAWRRAGARLAHVRSPFLLLSFLSAARACTWRSTIRHATFAVWHAAQQTWASGNQQRFPTPNSSPIASQQTTNLGVRNSNLFGRAI